MKILVDTNVILDVVLDRTPHAKTASRVLDRLEAGSDRGFVAWHSISNIYYLIDAPGAQVREMLRGLLAFLKVPPTSTDAALRATELPLKDFEDAMQVVAAEACGAELIVTRNVKDYAKSPVPALSPAEWLRSR
ncbi:MAG: PIN domain-containing protein [Myxococcota bacterium]